MPASTDAGPGSLVAIDPRIPTAFWWALGIFAIGLVAALVVLPSKVTTGECSVRKALSRGLAYARHLDRRPGTPETEAAPVGAGDGQSRIIGIR